MNTDTWGGGVVLPYITYTAQCAAQRGRDFKAPDLERVSVSEAFSRTGYKKLSITALSSA